MTPYQRLLTIVNTDSTAGSVGSIESNILGVLLIGGLGGGFVGDNAMAQVLVATLRVAAIQSVVHALYNSELPMGNYEKEPFVNISAPGDPFVDDLVRRLNALAYPDHDTVPTVVRRRRKRKSRAPVRRSVRVMDNQKIGSVIIDGRRRSARLMTDSN